jgi:hypothetical protein
MNCNNEFHNVDGRSVFDLIYKYGKTSTGILHPRLPLLSLGWFSDHLLVAVPDVAV